MIAGVSSAYAIDSQFGVSHDGKTNSISETFGSSGSVDSALNTQNGVTSVSVDFTTPYSFSDSITNLAGDYASVYVNVAGTAPVGTHTYGSDLGADHAMYWQTLSASQANSIDASVEAENVAGDNAYANTYVESYYAGGASINNYFGVADAFNNAAFVAQGVGSAHGDYIDAYTEAYPDTYQYAYSDMYGYTNYDNTYLNDYASYALSVGGGANAVSLLLKGDLQTLDTGGYQDNEVYAENAFTSTLGESSVDSYASGNSEMAVSPNASIWPGMAWAGQQNTLSMLQTATTTAGSTYMEAYGGLAYDQDAGLLGTHTFAGVGFTGQSHAADAAFVS
jgi:hypothetical protein